MPRFHSWCLILAAGLFWVGGCSESIKDPSGGVGGGTLSYMISVDQLADRLGLHRTFVNERYIELTDAANRVLLFTHPGGGVYVNGHSIGPAGSYRKEDGNCYFSELLVPQIRGYLRVESPRPPSVPLPSSSRNPGRIIVVDAGHGGKDPGATSYLGYSEKEVNLKVARKVAQGLRNLGMQVIMTRHDDTFIELNERAEIANRAGADLFVSIHHDSNHNRTRRGYTIYIAPNASETSRRAGRLIERALGGTGLSSNGMRTNDYRVLMRTQCPAVLVECGFLSNPSEAAILYDGTYQNRIAEAIVRAVGQVF